MGKKTPLYECHLLAQAKMVDFAGWDMPIHYGSQLAEHQYVREDAGVFDVSHMRVIDLEGQDVTTYLRFLLANNIDRLLPGKALYSCMLNEQGGILDDLIAYKIRDDFFRLVVNAGTSEKDWAWLRQHAETYSLKLTHRDDLVILATQGPKACEKLAAIFAEQAKMLIDLKPFHALTLGHQFVGRTGYTGEDGFEWILPARDAVLFWQTLLKQGFHPCGLGARDTLRLEAGFNLYDCDMDETVTPLESNLTWTVAFDPEERNFLGRQALKQQLQAGLKQNLMGLVLEEGIARRHQKIFIEGWGEGVVTSGSFSPTLKMGIALARLPLGQFDHCWVEIRGKKVRARVVKLPFVKYGKKFF